MKKINAETGRDPGPAGTATPPPIPDWSGPLYSPIVADGNAAILIRRNGDNGMDISAIVALGAPDIDAGFAAIERALTAITGENKWHRVGDDSGGTFASVASAICKKERGDSNGQGSKGRRSYRQREGF